MKNKMLLICILFIVLLMSFGYANFATDLDIYGTATISGSWLVHITNVEVLSATPKTDPTNISFTDNSFTFKTLLNEPGDKVVYKITIKNEGTIAAKLENISFTKDDNDGNAIVFNYTNPASDLEPQEETTMEVMVLYNSAISTLPNNLEKTLIGYVEYVQA